ncbi:Sodium-dependent glucose transporter 1-like protein [Dinothrombium tinctorium]|uniref:Sodium-dependent glucose transporter 1-like protein n=1 Tax=Dinothrombium tinctorium TaxID=1965070 RepID=A0A3S4RJ01_9ACAR|nr:Sodium-dependent glucose transporter 1-like protein [Dinothrombium tinctorium]
MALFKEVKARKIEALKTLITYSMIFSIGMSTSTLGVTLVDVQHLIGVSLDQITWIFTFFSFGSLFGSITCKYSKRCKNLLNFFCRNYNADGLIAKCFDIQILLALAAFTLAFTTSFVPFNTTLSIIYGNICINGFLNSFIITGANDWILYLWGAESPPFLQAFHFAFGFGSFSGPMVAGPFLMNLKNENGSLLNFTSEQRKQAKVYFPYAILGSLFLSSVVAFTIVYLTHKSNEPHPTRQQLIAEDKKNPNTFKMHSLTVAVSCFFTLFYFGIEFLFGNLLTTYVIHSDLKLDSRTGSYMTSVFWATFTFFRCLTIIIIDILGSQKLLIVDLILIVITNCILLPFGEKYVWSLWVAMILMGLGTSSINGAIFGFLQEFILISSKTTSLIFVSCSLARIIFPFIIDGSFGDYMDIQILLLVATSVLSLATAYIPWNTSIWSICANVALIGFLANLIVTGSNVWIFHLWGTESPPFTLALHFSYGCGALWGPILARPFLTTTNQNNGTSLNSTSEEPASELKVHYPFVIASSLYLATVVIFGIIYIIRRSNEPHPSRQKMISDDKESPQSLTMQFLTIGTSFMLMFFYFGIEMAFGTYLTAYAVNSSLKLDKSTGSYMTSAFWATFTSFRCLTIIIVDIIGPQNLLFLEFAFILISNCVFLLPFGDKYLWSLWTGVILMGMGGSSVPGAVLGFLQEFILISSRSTAIILYSSSITKIILSFLIVGVSLLDLQQAIGVTYDQINWIFPSGSIGSFSGSITYGLCGELIDIQILLLTVTSLLALSITYVPWNQTILTICVNFCFNGFLNSIIFIGSNVWIFHLWGNESPPFIQAFHFIFGCGALTGPIITRPFLTNTKQDKRTFFNSTSEENSEQLKLYYPYAIKMISDNKDNPNSITMHCLTVGATCLLIFFHFGIELSFGTFLTSYVVKSNLKLDKVKASYMTSTFWGTFTLFRSFTIIIVDILDSQKLLILDLILIVITNCFLLCLGEKYEWSLWIGVILMGIGSSSVIGSIYGFLQEFILLTSKTTSIISLSGGVTRIAVSSIFGSFIDEYPSINWIFPAGSIGSLLGSTTYGLIGDFIDIHILLLSVTSLLSFTSAYIPWNKTILSICVNFCFNDFLISIIATGSNVWIFHLWGNESPPFIQAFHFIFGCGALTGPIITRPFLTNTKQDKRTFFNSTSEENSAQLKLYYPYAIVGSSFLVVVFLFGIVYLTRRSNEPHPTRKKMILDNKENPNSFKMNCLTLGATCLFMFFYPAIEMSFGTFLTSYVVKSNLKLDKVKASYMTSTFWGTFTLFRSFTIIIVDILDSQKLLILDLILIVITNCFLLCLGEKYEWSLWIGIVLMGIGSSSVIGSMYGFLQEFILLTSKTTTIISLSGSVTRIAVSSIFGSFIDEYPSVFLYMNFVCGVMSSLLFAVLFFTRKQCLKIKADKEEKSSICLI